MREGDDRLPPWAVELRWLVSSVVDVVWPVIERRKRKTGHGVRRQWFRGGVPSFRRNNISNDINIGGHLDLR
ncbi:hypothetical protein Hanom_Chr02g00144681 [Helianthus anomalus]